MSGYEVGAFEALEWAWHMLREHRGDPTGVEDARLEILSVLSEMGEGYEVDFGELRAGLMPS
jgi:hypothetical protein